MKKLSTVLILLFFLASFKCTAAKDGIGKENKELMRFIETEILTDGNTKKLGEPIELSMRVTNKGERKYTFLPWGTPIENTLTGDCLVIKRNDQTIDYIGIMVKRTPPTSKDYVTLKHNETVLGKIDILSGYNLNEKGVYSIQYKEN